VKTHPCYESLNCNDTTVTNTSISLLKQEVKMFKVVQFLSSSSALLLWAKLFSYTS